MQRIIVTVQNEVGVLANITEVLAKENINLESINTEGRGDSGLVILTTEECDRALHALMNAGYRAELQEFMDALQGRFGVGNPWMVPDDMAGTAVYLASSDSDTVTGANVMVDNGYSAF